ncbi:uncharacterized protein VP01_1446g5 [Puccinia sorghi]|uniref:Uncharacterized protein n=1 Tax=Puccinia sorghi TaxID=27349 RepID=A0A0L6VK38_9BASI|nr:uncharacterized protein VP01_1446g5 [Puccinia sorghi]
MWAVRTLNCIQNKNTLDVTPYEAFYTERPQLDKVRGFGSTALVLVAPKKRNKLDDQLVEGQVVGHLDKSKGWTFWNKEICVFGLGGLWKKQTVTKFYGYVNQHSKSRRFLGRSCCA